MNRTNRTGAHPGRFRALRFVGLVAAAALGAAGVVLRSAPSHRAAPVPPPAPPPTFAPSAPEPGPAGKVPDVAERRAFPNVRLALAGIMREGSQARALIGVGDAPARAYTVGQELAAGITLRAILTDRVLVAYGDQSKTLRLAAGPADNTRVAAAAPPQPAGPVEGYKEINPDVDPTVLTTNRILAAKDFLGKVRLAPNPRGGFVVEQVERNSLYDKLGVRPGDVIYSIDTPATANIDESSMESVMMQTELQLEVYRNGRRVLLRQRLN